MSTIKLKFKNHLISDDNCLNALKQKFDQDKPNLVWVSDITYIKVVNKFYYLCVIIDLFARKVIAYKISNRMTEQLSTDTLNLAYQNRNHPSSVLFHSDRGSQYISKNFRRRIEELNFIQSFSKRDILTTMLSLNLFLSILRKKKLIDVNINLLMNFSLPLSNILKVSTTKKDLILTTMASLRI